MNVVNEQEQTKLTTEEREALILQHLPQVRWIAGNIHERVPAPYSVEDLVSTGILGLIAAIDNYDPTRNASLRTYAEYRIRGAILDSLRGLDGVPPHKRKRAKQLQAAILAAEQKLQRVPEEEDIAAELGITVREYQESLLEVRGVSIGSLDAVNIDDEGRALLRYIADEDSESAADMVERVQLERILAEAIEALPYVEKVVIDLYFREEMTLAEIARVVNLHTSRIFQLKMQAVLRLRTCLQNRCPSLGTRAKAAGAFAGMAQE